MHQTLSAGTNYDTIPRFDEYSHHFNSFDKATIKPQKVEILHLYTYTSIKKIRPFLQQTTLIRDTTYSTALTYICIKIGFEGTEYFQTWVNSLFSVEANAFGSQINVWGPMLFFKNMTKHINQWLYLHLWEHLFNNYSNNTRYTPCYFTYFINVEIVTPWKPLSTEAKATGISV